MKITLSREQVRAIIPCLAARADQLRYFRSHNPRADNLEREMLEKIIKMFKEVLD